MDLDFDAPTSQVVAMNLAMAAIEQWLKNVPANRSGSELGQEIGALYREIYTVVDELSPETEDEGAFDFDEDEDEELEDRERD